MQVDSLNIANPQSNEGFSVNDTTNHTSSGVLKATVSKPLVAKKIIKPNQDSILAIVAADTASTDTIFVTAKEAEPQYSFFNLFSNLKRASDSSVVKFTNPASLKNFTSGSVTYTGPEAIALHTNHQKSWVLALAIISLSLLITIRLYFQKHLITVISSLFNIQVAEKLLREKNVLIRRVFVFLNINFALTCSLYIYLAVQHFNVSLPVNNQFLVFLLIFGIFILFLLLRLFLQYGVGFIFDSSPLFKEYIHNTYLLNKNLGLFLLPLVIGVFYLQQNIADVVFYVCSGLVVITLLYRYLRAIQIIIKYKVLLFYSFLYFCTLEILPVAIGIKFVISLS